MKIAGVVVTYNRKEELIKNISSVKEQTKLLDKYFVVDNHGTDHTYDCLKDAGFLEDDFIKYIYLDDNIGGAGGFCAGLKAAFDDGYDLICMMDDDGRPVNCNTISQLFDTAVMLHNTVPALFLNSLVLSNPQTGELSFNLGKSLWKEEVLKGSKDGLLEGFINPFNGSVLSRELIELIGFPNSDFFIRGDEIDYSRRAIKAGAYVATVVTSLYYHPKEKIRWLKFGKKKVMGIWIDSPWKTYYLTRNRVYILKRDHDIKGLIIFLIILIMSTLKQKNKRIKYFKMINRGIVDAFNGRLGKIVQPGEE